MAKAHVPLPKTYHRPPRLYSRTTPPLHLSTMLRYVVTHRALFSGADTQNDIQSGAEQQAALLDQCARWAAGVAGIRLFHTLSPYADSPEQRV